MNLDRALGIGGWMSGPELHLLSYFANTSKKIIEVGSFQGRSSRAMADNTDGTIYCIDPWDGDYQAYGSKDYKDLAYQAIHYNGTDATYAQFYCNMSDHIQSGKVKVFRCRFDQFTPKDGEKFDFIFIDAIHEYDALKNDINHALPMLEKGGILAGHDYCRGWPGVIQAVDELFPNKQVAETIWSIKI